MPGDLVYQGRPVLSKAAKSMSGFTMIEMIVTVSIFSILVALTVPSMKDWIASTKVRAVGDAMQNGMRLAQSESLRRSRQVIFALTNSTNPQADLTSGSLGAISNGSYWVAVTIPAMTDGSETAQLVGSGVITSAGSTIAITGPAEVCFNSVGRLVTNGATGLSGGSCALPSAGTPPKYTYNIVLNTQHAMNVQLSLGGQVHMCDPIAGTLSASNPYGCAP